MGATYRVDTAHALRADESVLNTRRHTNPRMQDSVRHSRSSSKNPSGTSRSHSSISHSFTREAATAVDHSAVHQFLVTVFQEPSAAEFQHAIDAPRYEPLDRMLMRQKDGDIVAHVQLCHRTIQFGELSIPTVDIRHLGTLPEYRNRGLAAELLNAVEHETNLHGALILTVRSRLPEYFHQQGWSEWLNYSYSMASPRALISQLELLKPDAPVSYLDKAPSELHVRLWRRNELDAIRRIYTAQATSRFGGVARDESDWEWLVSSNSADRIYVAVRATETEAYSPTTGEVVGYAVVRDASVVELVAEESTDAARRLMVRICADAIENGQHCLEYHASPDSPMHSIFRSAGGSHSTVNEQHGRQLMAKLLYPEQFLLRMRKMFSRRANAARLTSPRSLTVGTESLRFRINLGRRQASIVYDDIQSPMIELPHSQLTSLLLGQTNIERMMARGLATVNDEEAFETATVLFPQLPTWRTPWEDLNARVR